MFHHVKDLQFNARVSGPDPRFAGLLLEQFGGANGELKAAMQYFTQAFACRQPYPDKYDLLMDIATEEFSHLEIVGATITMLLNGVNSELKNVNERSELMKMLRGPTDREELVHEAAINPEFLTLSGGGPDVTNPQGVPWSGSYVNANGDLTVDLRSNIAAESRAKIVYEYLRQFTDDPLVKDTLDFLMTREIAHFKQFQAALDSIEPNFPPGIEQGNPRFSHMYFNMSNGRDARGDWNEGQGPWGPGEEWVYVDDPVEQVYATHGQDKQKVAGTKQTEKEAAKKTSQLSKQRSTEIRKSIPKGKNQWSDYATREE